MIIYIIKSNKLITFNLPLETRGNYWVSDLDENNNRLNLVNIEEYDSVAKLSLIVMMDDEFQVKLTNEDIRGFQAIGDILVKI